MLCARFFDKWHRFPKGVVGDYACGTEPWGLLPAGQMEEMHGRCGGRMQRATDRSGELREPLGLKSREKFRGEGGIETGLEGMLADAGAGWAGGQRVAWGIFAVEAGRGATEGQCLLSYCNCSSSRT